MSMTPIFTPVAPWNWSSSNGSATAAQTQLAQSALLNKGFTTSFSYKVWNDIVDKVLAGRLSAGKTWKSDYSTLANAYATANSGLTSSMFNAVLENIGYPYWTWWLKSGSTGYTGRELFRGKATNGITSADNVYGSYIIEALAALNIILGVYSGDIDRTEITASGTHLLTPQGDAIVRHSLPLLWNNSMANTITAQFSRVPSYLMHLAFSNAMQTYAELSQVQGGLSAVNLLFQMYSILRMEKSPTTHFNASVSNHINQSGTLQWQRPFGLTAVLDSLLTEIGDAVAKQSFLLTASGSGTVTSVNNLEYLPPKPFNVLSLSTITGDCTLRYGFPFELTAMVSDTVTAEAILLAQMFATLTESFNFVSTINGTMDSGVVLDFLQFNFGFMHSLGATLGATQGLPITQDIDFSHTISGLMHKLPLAPFNSVVVPITFSTSATMRAGHATTSVSIANTSTALTILPDIETVYSLTPAIAHTDFAYNINVTDIRLTNLLTALSATVSGTQSASLSVSFVVPSHMSQATATHIFSAALNIEKLPTVNLVANSTFSLTLLSNLEGYLKDWLYPVQEGTNLYIRQVSKTTVHGTWLDIEEKSMPENLAIDFVSDISATLFAPDTFLIASEQDTLLLTDTMPALSSASMNISELDELVLVAGLELGEPAWIYPSQVGSELTIKQAYSAIKTNSKLEVL